MPLLDPVPLRQFPGNLPGPARVTGFMRSFRLALLAVALAGSAAFAAESAESTPTSGFILTLSTQDQLDAGRTEEEKGRAGLDRLTDAERKRLDELVANALAARVAGPRNRPRLKDSDINGPARKTEVHGSVSVGYGWGRGGEVRTGSVYVHTYDPDTGVGIGIGVSTASGNGLWGWPGYYDSFYGYPYDYGYYSPVYRYPVVIRDGFGPGYYGPYRRGRY